MTPEQLQETIVCWVKQAILESVDDDGEWQLLDDLHEGERMSLATTSYVWQMYQAIQTGEIPLGTWDTG